MRRFVFFLVFAALCCVVTPAFAGPYLNTAAMLIRESLDSADWVRINLGDATLTKTAHSLAEARLQAARGIEVPKEVEKVHPHLMLALENMERAMQAAIDLQPGPFLQYLDTARGEIRTYKSLLQQIRLTLPDGRTSGSSHH
jgi:hypothetical protein